IPPCSFWMRQPLTWTRLPNVTCSRPLTFSCTAVLHCSSPIVSSTWSAWMKFWCLTRAGFENAAHTNSSSSQRDFILKCSICLIRYTNRSRCYGCLNHLFALTICLHHLLPLSLSPIYHGACAAPRDPQ